MQSFPITLTLCTPALVEKNCSSNTVTLLPPILKLGKLQHSLSQTLGRLDEWFRDRKELPWKGSSSEDVVSLNSLNSSFLHAICVSWCIEDVATLCRKYSGEWAHFYPGLVFVSLWEKNVSNIQIQWARQTQDAQSTSLKHFLSYWGIFLSLIHGEYMI